MKLIKKDKRDVGLAPTSSSQEIDSFLQQAKSLPSTSHDQGARLLFALDATASRQSTWDHACHIQSKMFLATDAIGSLNIQLCYFYGYNFFYSSPWYSNTEQLLNKMNSVQCSAGHTQIGKLFNHAILETRKEPIKAIVYIGDSMEEDINLLSSMAGTLGLLKTPIFIFQEGNDLITKRAFKQFAQLSGGAYHAFNNASSSLLAQLLIAVAIYASGNKKALQDYSAQQNQNISGFLEQLK